VEVGIGTASEFFDVLYLNSNINVHLRKY